MREVLAGAIGVRGPELGYNASFVYPVRGIGALPEGLAKRVPPVELGRAPRRIDFRRREAVFDDEIIAYRSLVTTAPLDAFGKLLDDPPNDVRGAFGRLRCTSLSYLDVAIDGPLGRDFHWIYVPEARFPFYRVGAYSNFSPDVAPAGASSLYVELADREPGTLAEVLPGVVAGLVEMGVIDAPSRVRFARLRRLGHAYVIFDHAYFASLDTLRPFLDAHGIVSTGRYGAWNYSSMEDALTFGRDAALRVVERSRV
jgi:protoporphyrinogen oxidase